MQTGVGFTIKQEMTQIQQDMRELGRQHRERQGRKKR
jgi:hypothetical protein